VARFVEAEGRNRIIGVRMRILLQHKQTGLYFRDIELWARTSSEAMDFCVLNKLNDVQLVLKFEEQKFDIVMPMDQPPPILDRPVKAR
jgi:hypothetical protein